ncbi:FkbM family methyltransferase [Okeania sp. SIO2C9]|uniref:FkbM family methyltransferase n=1 Tax=Okeania sp. SIO2C9 TaxID=2607791 RepID=UPI0025E939EB|nr:FkbM family methyltransferase [Okeania sp. SIO2C9]
MTLPWKSQFGTEVFLKGSKLDWGSEVLLTQFLDKGKSFIDVGANIGYYSLLAAPLSDKVYTFEPDPRIIKDLEENLSQFQNIHILREALYSESGKMEFNLSSTPEINSLVRKSPKDDKVVVKVNTLDNLMSEYPSLNVSCIKTDAEGADFQILLGGKNLLIRDQPLVLSELFPSLKLLKFIKSIGFSCFAFVKPKDKSKSHLPPKFMKIEDRPVNFRLKMIFLVPDRLLSEFEKLVDEYLPVV